MAALTTPIANHPASLEPRQAMPLVELDLAALVAQHQANVWRHLRYLGAEPAEADDLTQETFLAIARTFSSNRGFEQRSDTQTAAYLRTAARRQLLMLRRKQRRRVSTVSFDKPALEAAEAVWAEAEQTTGGFDAHVLALRECVDKLDGRPREAIDLTYRDNLGRSEIAERLGMKPDGVKSLLRRTRALLRECVERAASAMEAT